MSKSTTQLTSQSESFAGLVRSLLRLHMRREAGDPGSRATLARLASDARSGRSGHLFPFVVQHVCAPQNTQLEDDAMLFTELFAMRPSSMGSATLPQLLKQAGKDDQGSTEMRFRSLLGSRREELGTALRRVMARVDATKDLNWTDLSFVIRNWDRQPERGNTVRDVKREWARHYYSTSYQLNNEDKTKDATHEA